MLWPNDVQRPKINQAAPIDFAQAQDLPRARGTLSVRAKRRGETSVIADLHQSGSMKALFPRTASKALDLVFLNTAGGMTGGDVFDIAVAAEEHSRLTVTTQAAERIYGAVDPKPARLASQISIADGARIDWLPQETIQFDQGALQRRLTVDMAPDATFLMVEPLVLGRKTMGEVVRSGMFNDDVRIWRGGDLIFADAVRMAGDLQGHMAGAATGGEATAMASVLYAAPNADAYLQPIRDMLPATAGVSLIREGVLFARLLASDSYDLRQALCPVISRLHGAALPKTWML